ncbi:MAG: hypothetical protein MJK04_22160, partial [Psychrosphaera sp.]|nr:hypothetical protein [Psychrosphaera sp.]
IVSREYNSDNVSDIYLRNSADQLSYTAMQSPDFDCDNCKMAYWQESADFRFFKYISWNFWLSNQLSGANMPNDELGKTVEFPGLDELRDVYASGGELIAQIRKPVYSLYYQVLLYQNGQFVVNDELRFGARPIFVDMNQDNKSDVVYVYDNADTRSSFVAVRYRTENGFSEEKILLEIIAQEYQTPNSARLVDVKDVSEDGYPDISVFMADIGGEGPVRWYLFNPQNDSFETQHELDSYSGSYYNKLYLGDMNKDGLTDVTQMTDIGIACEGYPTVCGQLQYKLKQSQDSYTAWQKFDDIEYTVRGINYGDIDLDGRTEVYVRLYEERTSQSGLWYKFDDQGNPVKHTTPYSLENYVDIFADGTPYFVDFNLPGYLRQLTYSYLRGVPVVSEVQTMPALFSTDKRLMFDVDKDGDDDILQFDKTNLYLIKNNH